MALVPGTRLGAYEVLTLLGSGGMGEVYRAKDTKLNREVAIKVLPNSLAQDPERLARFEREARTLAALNHPNIAHIHGFEDSTGVPALVMELVEGPTLADRIAKGPIPIDEALPIAKQIAEALWAAHEQEIIHRDLKPANIKVRDDGTVKVLDFGLAKALDKPRASSPNVTQSPTITTPAVMTGVGVILGTAAYMSPEQAKGWPADKRSDVWAFGCVLYEMVTGKRAFGGDGVSDTLAAVLRGDPDWSLLPSDVPGPISTLIKRCVAKDRRRIAEMSTVSYLLTEHASLAPPSVVTGPLTVVRQQPPWKRLTTFAGSVLFVGAAIAGAAVWLATRPTPQAVMRFGVTLPDGQQFTNMGRQIVAVSPDGTQIVYVANARLYLRSMSTIDAKPIPGTENPQGGVNSPVFSPDGRSVAFFSLDGTLKRVDLASGAGVTMASVTNPDGLSWGSDGILVGQGAKGIMRVPPAGGPAEWLVHLKEGEQAHGPQMLPDGQTIVFTLVSSGLNAARWDRAQIIAFSLKSGERKVLIEGGSDARYLPTGHLVYAVGGVIFAVPFDLKRLQVTGTPAPILPGVRRSVGGQTGAAQFSVSNTGTLIFLAGPVSTLSGRDLALVDRGGKVEALKLPPGSYDFPRIAPDGRRVAVATDDGREANIWVYDLFGTTSLRRLTFGGRNRFPIWSTDGRRIAFQSDREGDLAIFWQDADGQRAAERLTRPEHGSSHIPESWSPHHESFLYCDMKGSVTSLWLFSVQDRKSALFGDVRSFGSKTTNSAFSPDGRWVAYQASLGTEGSIVYVQPFPATGAKYQISTASMSPLWTPDGKELFYLTTTYELYVVSFVTQPHFRFGTPILQPPKLPSAASSAPRSHDITPDGQRFISVIDPGQSSGTREATQIQVALNWFEELKRLVPVR